MDLNSMIMTSSVIKSINGGSSISLIALGEDTEKYLKP